MLAMRGAGRSCHMGKLLEPGRSTNWDLYTHWNICNRHICYTSDFNHFVTGKENNLMKQETFFFIR
jgi:hypothetical protein